MSKTICRKSAETLLPKIIMSLCNPTRVMTGVLRNLLFVVLFNPSFCNFKYTIVNLSSCLNSESSDIKRLHVTLAYDLLFGHTRSRKSYTEKTCSPSAVIVARTVASPASLSSSADIQVRHTRQSHALFAFFCLGLTTVLLHRGLRGFKVVMETQEVPV